MIVRIARLDEILALRHAVLRPGLPRDSAHFDGDDEAVHIAALDDAGVVGCATLMSRPLDGVAAAQVRGMATRPGCERRGVGTAVLRFAERIVADEWRFALAWCNARTTARGFYERAGWRVVSSEFHIAGVGPHVRMVREL